MKMVLICYDVSVTSEGGPRRLRRVARACLDYGQRVQFSVFECVLDQTHWLVLKERLLREIDPELDSLRFYFLGTGWRKRLEVHGCKDVLDLEQDPLIL